MRQDLKFAIRSLLKRPAFAGVAVLTLALGIGANTAIFSIVNAVLLRPLPYAGADRIVRLRGTTAGSAQPGNLSPMDFLDLRAAARRFDRLAAYNNYAGATLTGTGEPERLSGTRVSADFFSALGTAPQLGRDFRPEDDVPGASPVVMLTDAFWRRRFAGDASIIGRTIHLNGIASEVIGVLPRTFAHPFPENAQQPDVYVPFRLDRKENLRSGHYLQALGRLKPGVPLVDGQADLSTIAADLERRYPGSNTGRGVRITPLLESMTASVRAPMFILLGTVVFVLVIACANLANLLLARATARQQEIALRQALGASRPQLIRQLLTESMLLACAGGGAGLLIAHWALQAFTILGANAIPRGDSIALDARVLFFTSGLSLVTGLMFGVGPAMYATRSLAQTALKDGGRAGEGRPHRRAQQTLIASEIALTLMLLVCAGLLAKSFWRLHNVSPGFVADRLLTLQTSLPLARYAEGDEIPFFQRLESRIAAVPGVTHVGAINILPLGGNYSCDGFDVEGRPPSPPGKQPCAENRSVTPEYFSTMGVPLVRGRTFTGHDVEGSRPVVIVNEKMASIFFPDRDPIGMHIVRSNVSREIVGIVGSVKHFGLDHDVTPEMYTPHAQQPSYHSMTLVVRASGDPIALASSIRRELTALDRDIPLSGVRTMNQLIEESTIQPRFRTLLIGTFAALAVVLSIVGVAGVVAFAVGRRTHEIGVRVALGATRRQVISLLLVQGMWPAAIGLAVGLAGAMAATRVLAGLLFGVAATDAPVFASAIVVVLIASFGATYVPARRASSIDAMDALRMD